MRSTRPATVTAAPSALESLRDGVAGRVSHGVRVDPVLLQGLELGHPDPHLLGQPRLIVILGQVGL